MSPPGLADRIRRSDAAAFDELARRHADRLTAVARRVTGCTEVAAELVQDVFLRLWRDRETLEIREHLDGYLARAVRNRALDHRKRILVETRWREAELLEMERARRAVVTESIGDRDPDWSGRLSEALDRLPPKRQQIMLLRWRDGLGYAEIAARLGVSSKTVENQIGRGLKALRAMLAADHEGSSPRS